MPASPTHEFSPVPGQEFRQEFRPATAKLWTMLFVFAMLVPAGAVMAYCWWYQQPLPGGIVLKTKAGVAGILAVPLGIFLSVVMVALIGTAKRLVIGEKCIQLLSRDRVVVHIPYENLAAALATGDNDAGAIVLKLRRRDDPLTLVPASTKDQYDIQCMIYGKPPGVIHEAIRLQLPTARTDRTAQPAAE